MTPDVITVKVIPDYFIKAEFSNGESRLLDMRPYLNYPAFCALKDDALFLRAHVTNGVVAWNDEIDLSPDLLYLRGEIC